MKTPDTEKRQQRKVVKERKRRKQLKDDKPRSLLVRKFGQRPLTSKRGAVRIAVAGTNEVFNVEHIYEQDESRKQQ